jgi:hypothetical protein
VAAVERLADMLLEELLGAQAQELGDLADAVSDQMLHAELLAG